MFPIRILLAFFLFQASAPLVIAQGPDLLDRLKATGYVNDYAGIFSIPEKQRLESLLQDLDRKARAQVAVVTIPSLEGEEIRDFANLLFEKWGIGYAGEDRGVLVLMASGDRRIWVEVGYGLEGILPDGRVGRILDTNVIPSFRSQRYSEGLSAGVAAIAQIIAEDSSVELTGGPAPAVERPLTTFEKLVGLVFLGILFLIIIRNPWILLFLLSSGGGGRHGGGFGSGGFGGFGGGLSGGGGAGRSW